jgi:phenylacetate-CoA ligase
MRSIKSLLEKICCSSPYFIRFAMINLYGYLLARRRFGNKFEEYFEFFEKTQWQTPEDIKKFQMSKLRQIIEIAYRKVPYYRRLLSKYGLTPDDFHEIDDLKKLPTLTKQDIRGNFHDLLNEDIKNISITKDYSSGTTGQKLEFYLPKELAFNVNYSLVYRSYSWAGIHLGDKRVTIGARLFAKKTPYWIYNKAENQLLLSIHHLNEETVDSYIEKIKQFSPVFIQGHPTGISFISQRMVQSGTSIGVKAVCTTAETLDDSQRKAIMQAFNTEVFESYGSSECVIAAFECEKHTGFHEASELGIIEFEKTPSGLYKVIGTSLWNYAMPFLRYEIEDLVELSPNDRCSCGRGLPLKIKRILGRIDDVLASPDGGIILPVSIRMQIKPLLKPFENYQLQQLDKKEYTLLVEGKLNDLRKNQFLKATKEVLGDLAEVEIKEADRLMTKGGKVQNILNLYKRQQNHRQD